MYASMVICILDTLVIYIQVDVMSFHHQIRHLEREYMNVVHSLSLSISSYHPWYLQSNGNGNGSQFTLQTQINGSMRIHCSARTISIYPFCMELGLKRVHGLFRRNWSKYWWLTLSSLFNFENVENKGSEDCKIYQNKLEKDLLW